MTEKHSPFLTLLDLVSTKASGELVAVSAACELHVYLQSGRIAWATDSTQPFAFRRHLLDHTSLTTEVFHEVLEACRRERLPLGETLIARGAATLEQIRAALTHQISDALRSLRNVAIDRTIFLERRRQFASYDARLTFDIRTLVRPSSSALLLRLGLRGGDSGGNVLERVSPLLPDAARREVWAGEHVVERDPRDQETFVPRAIVKSTLLDGADLAVVRTERETVLGVVLPGAAGASGAKETLWCRLDVGKAFGFTLTAMSKFAGAAASVSSNDLADHARGIDVFGSPQVTEEGATVRALIERAPEIEGILFCETESRVSGAVRSDIDPERLRGIARRRAAALEALEGSSSDEPYEIEGLGYQLRSLGTGEQGLWCFGMKVPASERMVWLFTARSSAQGLGWAYLTCLARQLAEVPAGELAATG